MEPLLPSFRRELRARAHHLHPVVTIGQHGLTPSVLHEVDVALTAHELIKVRVFSEDRDQRGALLERICDALACAAIQQIGKLLVLWRPRPPGDKLASAPKPPVAKARRPGGVARAAPVGSGRRRRTAGVENMPAAARPHAPKPQGTSPPVPPKRVRKPGPAPTGVPRAAAPRRRRSAP